MLHDIRPLFIHAAASFSLNDAMIPLVLFACAVGAVWPLYGCLPVGVLVRTGERHALPRSRQVIGQTIAPRHLHTPSEW